MLHNYIIYYISLCVSQNYISVSVSFSEYKNIPNFVFVSIKITGAIFPLVSLIIISNIISKIIDVSMCTQLAIR